MKMIKILKITLAVAFLLQGFGMVILTGAPIDAQAALFKPIDFQPQIGIPDSDFENTMVSGATYDPKTGKANSDLLAKYIQAFYNYGLAAVGILAAVVLMAGGVLWLTSAGNDTKISQAKELITGSIVGTAILLGSYIILNTVNPELLKLKTISINSVSPVATEAPKSCDEANDKTACVEMKFCTWKNEECITKIEAGEAKCSTDKESVPDSTQCCCQISNNGSYINCKWATFIGDVASGPAAGPCSACGDNYTDVTNSQQGTNLCSTQLKTEYCQGYWCNQDQNMLKYYYCNPAVRTNGDDCPHNGYCYNGTCWTADANNQNNGQLNEPCGNETPPGKCLTDCPDGYKRELSGGRSCGESLKCCILESQ